MPALRRSARRALALAIALCPFSPPARALQEPARPSLRAVRVETPPRIDGRLDDAVWQLAEVADEFLQVEPQEGAAPSERTELRVLYDADHLYLGLRFFDSRPQDIVATTRERDAFLDADDRVEIVIDTFLDRRNAYFFQINAGGSKGDGLVTGNGGGFNKPWDGIWEGRATIDDGGWSAELALPFKTLNFREGLETWGLNLQRFLGRNREEMRWATPSQNVGVFSIYHAGNLTGLRGLRQGLGLDLAPFFVGRFEDDRADPSGEHLLGQPGLDAFYKITPNLTFGATFNTDFAETEVDDRQINLTRFPLFFPERRDFFLQDAGLFAFGDLGTSGGSDLIPFFSRRIGIADDGTEVPLLAGAKLTGRAGPYELGLLDVETDRTDALERQNLFVSRIARQVGEQSSVGLIATAGDPTSERDNHVYGVDATWRTSDFLGDRNLRATAWALRADSEGAGDDDLAYGASLRYPNDVWSAGLELKEIQEDFYPALGFVPRRGVRKYDASTTFKPRVDEVVRNLEFSVGASVVTDTDDRLETSVVELQPFGIEWESGDALRVELEHTVERLADGFDIVGVPVDAGDYDFTRVRLELETANKRDLWGVINVEAGDFFDGHRQRYLGSLVWRPNMLFNGTAELVHNEVSLPAGDFDTQVARLRASLFFTPELTWSNFAQWDSVSDGFGLNSRLRWILEPGRELFVVYNEALEDRDAGLTTRFRELAFKLVYTLRF